MQLKNRSKQNHMRFLIKLESETILACSLSTHMSSLRLHNQIKDKITELIEPFLIERACSISLVMRNAFFHFFFISIHRFLDYRIHLVSAYIKKIYLLWRNTMQRL